MADSENVLQTLKTVIQDVVAPDVRALKVQFESFQRQSDAQFKALMAAIQQSKAETELSTYKQIAALSERVAALEARHQ